MLPPESLKLLYSSFVLPHLHYGIAAWGGCSGQNKNRIISIQKRAVRTISKAYWTAHTEPRMKKLGILRLDEIYVQQCASIVHDVINNRAPLPMKNFLSFGRESTTTNLRSHQADPHHLRTPTRRSKLGRNSFCSKGPQLWNSLPREIQEIQSKNSFKFRLKRHILDSYTDRSDCNNPRCTDKRHHH